MPNNIKFNINAQIEAKELRENRRIYIREIAKATSISEPTLNRIIHNKSQNIWVSKLVALCTYFECELKDLVTYD